MDGFLDLPREIIINIIKFNDIYEFNRWIRVSKTLYLLVMQNRLLWDNYLYRDFNKIDIPLISVDIDANIYKKCFQLTKLLSMVILKNKNVKNISELLNLQVLYLYNNQITEIPATLGNLVNLQEVYLSHNQIKEIPAALSNLANLQRLYLSHNQIKEIPAALSNLANLQRLLLSNNQITEIPATFSSLTNLRELSLSGNRITEISA